MDRIIHLCKKWVNRTLSCEKAEELYFLMFEYVDTDLHYILYGFPHASIKEADVFKRTEEGIYEVGVKKKVNRTERKLAFDKIFKKYYLNEK